MEDPLIEEADDQRNIEKASSCWDLFTFGYIGLVMKHGSMKQLECFSGSKVELLSYIKERTQGRLDGWYLIHLSQGGKEVLLKSTAGGIPVFPMSCFRLPKTLLLNLSTIMADFWWGTDVHRKKIHWVSWEKMCLPKSNGGMGFRDLESFNQALLAKQAWKILTQPLSLVAKFLKSRYFNEGEFLEAVVGDRPSFAWRSLVFGRELLKKGLRHRVGDGLDTRVWLDKWVEDPEEGLRAPWIKNQSFDVNLRANSLIDMQTKRWNLNRLHEVFVAGDVEIIMRNQPVVERADYYTWKFNKSGQITVKSAYWLASTTKAKRNLPEAFMEPSVNGLKEVVWKVKTLPKIRVFLWKSLSSALPTADLLNARGMKVDNRCQTCGDESDSINHLLFECCFARRVWAESSIPHRKDGFDEGSVFTNMHYLLNLKEITYLTEEDRRVWPWILWNLWKRRNEMLFEGRCVSAMELVQKAVQEAKEWFMAQMVEEEWSQAEKVNDFIAPRKWVPPDHDWVMCNIGVEFSKSKGLAGGAWVLRNERGVVLCHSRRAFSSIKSREEAKVVVVLWALESMRSQRQDKIIFAGECGELFGAVERPQAWPSFLFQASLMGNELAGIPEWKLRVVTREANRGAFFIAQSVIKYGLVNSYVATGHPSWLFEFFVNESRAL